MDANRILPEYQLKSELARFSLVGPREELNRKLAWANSICFLVLLIGVFGNKPGRVAIKPLPALEEPVAAIVEPAPPLPQAEQPPRELDPNEQDKPDTPQVVVVTPEAPSIKFAVPTIGNIVAPAALAQAPPLNPLRPPAPLRKEPITLSTTGAGGERPYPPYPRIALDQGQQGTVTLLISADEAGVIASVDVKQSSGFPMLDRSAVDYVRRHWLLPAGPGSRLFETSIIYQITPR